MNLLHLLNTFTYIYITLFATFNAQKLKAFCNCNLKS